MIKKWLLIPLILVSTSNVANNLVSDEEPVALFGYNSLYADLSAGTTNDAWLDNSNQTTVTVGANYLVNGHWIVNADYSAQFFHPEEITVRVDRALLGGGYRYPISETWGVYGVYGIGAIKSKVTENDTDRSLESLSEVLQATKLGTNIILSQKLVANGEIKFTRSDVVDENNYRLGLNYQALRALTAGVFYQYRDVEGNYINELGVRFMFLY